MRIEQFDFQSINVVFKISYHIRTRRIVFIKFVFIDFDRSRET